VGGALVAADAAAVGAAAEVGAALVDAAGAAAGAEVGAAGVWDEQAIRADAIAVVTIPPRTWRRLSFSLAAARRGFRGGTVILPILRASRAQYRLTKSGWVAHRRVANDVAVATTRQQQPLYGNEVSQNMGGDSNKSSRRSWQFS